MVARTLTSHTCVDSHLTYVSSRETTQCMVFHAPERESVPLIPANGEHETAPAILSEQVPVSAKSTGSDHRGTRLALLRRAGRDPDLETGPAVYGEEPFGPTTD